MSNALYCARYQAKKREAAVALQKRADLQAAKILALEKTVNRLREENERLRLALLQHGVQQ